MDEYDKLGFYKDVHFRKREVNTLITKFRPAEDTQPVKRLRRRNASWGDWTAALSTLAYEQAITSEMKTGELLDLVNLCLQRWEVSEVNENSARQMARTVLERLRNNPPARPLF